MARILHHKNSLLSGKTNGSLFPNSSIIPPWRDRLNRRLRHPDPAGLTTGLLIANPNLNAANGAGASNSFRLSPAQAATADQDHNYPDEQAAYDNGKMDLFPFSVGTADTAAVATATGASAIAATKGLTMGYYDGNTTTAIWNYAQHYAMNDHSF